MSTSEVLAEKRRRNAAASAKFRSRRKQREMSTLTECSMLRARVAELEAKVLSLQLELVRQKRSG